MNWANHTDYQDSIQNPQHSFSEPDLKVATIANDMLGLPRVMSGNFASVYELETGGQKWAIRCFVRQVSGQQARYTILSKHLSTVGLSSIVKFEYITKGINVRNEWYPIVKMEWVKGVPMHVFVDENHQDGVLMARLAEQWRELLRGIRSHHIAHGDLQHGNVMVTPEREFRLVDYDGMYVPGFGRGRSPELGHANYQHPRRTPDYYEEALDNFGALIGYASFLAISKEPQLWAEFSTGDNLLFVASDFHNPQKSKIIERLKNSPDQRVKLLAALIESACLRPVAMVPDFLETAELVEQGKLPVDLNAAAAPISTATPNWMAEEAPSSPPAGTRIAPTGAGGTRMAPAVSATRASGDSKPVTTSAWSGTRGAEEDRPAPARALAPAPTVDADHSGGLNLWPLAAVGLALLALVPSLRLIAGSGSFICGLVGLLRGGTGQTPNKWVGVGGGMLGVALAVWGAMEMKKSSSTEPTSVEEATESSTAPVGSPPVSQQKERPLNTLTTANPRAVTPNQDESAKPASLPELKLRPIGLLKGHAKSVDSLAFAHDSLTLASGGADGTVRLWDAQSGELRHTLSGITEGVESMTFSPNNQVLHVVAMDNTLTLWEVATGKLRKTAADHRKTIWPVAVSPDGAWVASGTRNRKVVRLLDLVSGATRAEFSDQESWIKSVDFSNDGKLVVSQSFDDAVRIWDTASGRSRQSFTVSSNTLNGVVISKDNRFAACAVEARDVGVWEVDTGKQIHRLSGHGPELKSLCFFSNGAFLASGGDDRTIRIWDLKAGVARSTLTAHEAAVTSLAISADGKQLASGGADKLVKLWDSTALR